MKLKDRLLVHIKNHMHKLINDNDFSLLEGTANLSNALQTGKLEQLPYDEQIFWLNRVDGMYRYFIRDGNPDYCNNPIKNYR